MFTFIIITLALSIGIIAQRNLITPDNNKLQMKYLKPYKNSFRVIAQNNGKEKDYGLLIDELKIIEKDGKKFYERIQKMPDIKLIDTSINNFKDLSPVLHSGHNSSGYMYLNFGKEKVTGERYFPKNDSTFNINTNMPGPYFDSNMFEVILTLLPLQKNFTGEIPYYEFESGGYILYKAKVAGEEKIETDKGVSKNTWVLDITDGNSKSSIYIAKDTREVVKKKVIRSPQVKIFFDKVD